MNWETSLILAALMFVVALAVVRTEPRTRRWILLVLPLPTAILVYRWVRYKATWLELGVAFAAGALGYIVWWFLLGRRLPPPRGSTTRVWTKEDPF